MSVTFKSLIGPKFAESTQTTQYTASGTRTAIDKLTALNVTASNVTFSVNLLGVGGAASSSNLIVDGVTIAPGETRNFAKELTGHTLENGEAISTLASSPSAIAIRCSGREYS